MKTRTRKLTPRVRQLNGASLRYYYRKKAERAALNLTTRGTPRVYELHEFNAHGRRRANLRARKYVARLNAAGLTRRGNPKRGLILLTPLESDYRRLRANVVVPPMSFEDVFTVRNEGVY